MHRSMLGWLEDPSEHRGVYFARDEEGWDFWSYAELARRSRSVAVGLVRTGVQREGIVLIAEQSGADFISAFFGAMLAGAIPSPAAPPIAFQDLAAYNEQMEGRLSLLRPAAIVVASDLVELFSARRAVAGLREPLTAAALAARGSEAERCDPGRQPAQLALIQFTSGSSGRSRGVRVPFASLEANIHAIRRWLEWTESDALASWLPVHHDMGLVGCLLAPIVSRSNLWLLRPQQFIREPARYLACFGALGARITAIPNFGLEYILRRVQREALQELDFSEWRAVIVGSERIAPKTLDRFHRLLAPFGLRRRALLPAYGMAEATLAITGVPLREEWTGALVDGTARPVGRRIATDDEGWDRAVVGCGRPLDGLAIRVEDERGERLPDGCVGEIVICGTSVTAGYLGNGRSSSLARISRGTLRSGDAGFMIDGQLFVLGRLGDSLKVRGIAVFAEDLELELAAAGVPANRHAAVLGVRAGVPTAVSVLEDPREGWVSTAHSLLRRRLTAAALVLVEAPRGTIPRTTSGKPRRRMLWRAFLEGRLPGIIVTRREGAAESPPDRPREPEPREPA